MIKFIKRLEHLICFQVSKFEFNRVITLMYIELKRIAFYKKMYYINDIQGWQHPNHERTNGQIKL